ncbi:MAG TPA: biosynthetic-type acetolactate synthase large subunit [Dehalococcoidia bacterium]|nr:biosynthetic-type acetolactate synthase large subunit [Dehalococcoidia bacterium]
MQRTGAQMVCEALIEEGVDVMFGYPGGAILPFYDVLTEYPQLRHILTRHEQAAAHAADGYARSSGKVGVCVATSGPGATNLVTGLATAMMDSAPIVAITGQVAREFVGKDAFQETDITGITLPITKHNYLVQSIEELPSVIKQAFHIARTGRPGPVLIDIPKDIQNQIGEFRYPGSIDIRGYRPTIQGHAAMIKRAAQAINQAKRPIIAAGHGVIISGAHAELRALAERANIPLVNTLLGQGSFPGTHPLNFGMGGMHGLAHAITAVQECDLLIGIGMRMDDRFTGKTTEFAPKATVIHIDIDPSEIGKNIRAHIPIVGDVKHVLEALLPNVESNSHAEWIAQIERWRREMPSLAYPNQDKLLPQFVIEQLYQMTGNGAYIVTDVGQAQMWAAQFFLSDKPNSHISSGGLGTMGFALPAAMGVKVAFPDEPVWAISGDGGFQMNLQELMTCVQENIPVKVAIINNGYLGMVRQWQELFYQRRYSATPIMSPDYVQLARAFGIPGYCVRTRAELAPAVEEAISYPGPVVIDFRVEEEENCYPMIAPGTSNSQIILPQRSQEARI